MPAINSMGDAIAIAHTLSEPSKMPWFGYSLPARTCKTGSKLAQVAGTVCSGCYALKGRYNFPAVQNAMNLRFFAINHPQWAEAMIFQLRSKSRGKKDLCFRWHDSGDIQGVTHLAKIVSIAEALPEIKFWLPTREVTIVREYLRTREPFPANLIVRLSAHKVGADYESALGLPISTVGLHGRHKECDAYERGGKCGPCRACWTSANVNYPLH